MMCDDAILPCIRIWTAFNCEGLLQDHVKIAKLNVSTISVEFTHLQANIASMFQPIIEFKRYKNKYPIIFGKHQYNQSLQVDSQH